MLVAHEEVDESLTPLTQTVLHDQYNDCFRNVCLSFAQFGSTLLASSDD